MTDQPDRPTGDHRPRHLAGDPGAGERSQELPRVDSGLSGQVLDRDGAWPGGRQGFADLARQHRWR